jgi:hypothetical protein
MVRKVGNTLEIQGVVSLSGAPTAMGNLIVSIPLGTIDTSQIVDTASNTTLARGNLVRASAANRPAVAKYFSATEVQIFDSDSGGILAVTPTVPFTWASGSTAPLYITVPIVEFA